jgi:hypothetical protein
MSKTTRATQALQNLGVKFTLHAYDYDPDAASIACRRPKRWALSLRACSRR